MPIDNIQPDPCSTTCTTSSATVRNFAIATLSMVVLFISATALAGQIYKWTDAEGKVHYGSEKPADTAVPAEQMKVNTSKTGVDTGAAALDDLKQKTDDEAEKIKEEGIPAQPPVPSLPMKEVKQRCQKARQDLATIQARAQLRERDEKGNVRYVSEKEKEQRMKAAKKQIREYCN